MKKFELVNEMTKEFNGKKLFRVRALISFSDVKAGDLGGWVEKESNLDQNGDAWIYDDARISGNACIFGNVIISDNACISGDVIIYGKAWIFGNAWISGDACISGDAHWLIIGPIGSEDGFLTAFRQKDNSIVARTGCLFGSLEDFETAVNKRYGESIEGQIYRALIPVIKMRLADV